MADLFDLLFEEGLRHINHDTGAITRLAVGIDRAAVEQSFQSPDGEFNHVAARLTVNCTDEAYAACGNLRIRVIGVAVDKALALILVVLERVKILHVRRMGHDYSAAPIWYGEASSLAATARSCVVR